MREPPRWRLFLCQTSEKALGLPLPPRLLNLGLLGAGRRDPVKKERQNLVTPGRIAAYGKQQYDPDYQQSKECGAGPREHDKTFPFA
jgi:hypothetical protein